MGITIVTLLVVMAMGATACNHTDAHCPRCETPCPTCTCPNDVAPTCTSPPTQPPRSTVSGGPGPKVSTVSGATAGPSRSTRSTTPGIDKKDPRCGDPKLPKKDDTDICRQPRTKYTYDHDSRKCESYQDGGCGSSSLNMFETLDECNEACAGKVMECPYGYDSVGEKYCYSHEKELVNHGRADVLCLQKENGHLVMLQDEDERQLFNDYIRKEVGEGLNETCHKKIDLIFLVDSSLGITQKGFDRQLEFIGQFVNHFEVGPGDNQAQFAVINTGFTTDIHIRLNDYSNAKDFIGALDPKWYFGRGEVPTLAFRSARTDVLLAKNGARDDSEKVVILIGDGASESIPHLIVESQLLKDMDVRIYELLVHTNHEKDAEFDQVVSAPVDQHMFHLDDSSQLTTRISTIVETECWGEVVMWIGGTPDTQTDFVNNRGVVTTMSADFTTRMEPMAVKHEYVCEVRKVFT